MNRNMEIVILSDDEPSVRRYSAGLAKAGLGIFKVAYLPARRIITEPGFDALYWTLSAAERWNVRPVEDVIQIVRTNETDRREGWPDYLLVGLALSPANAASAELGLRAWVRALLIALARDGAATISRVKVPMDMIALNELAAERAAAVFAEAERGLA
jgi:hypothetical protein